MLDVHHAGSPPGSNIHILPLCKQGFPVCCRSGYPANSKLAEELRNLYRDPV